MNCCDRHSFRNWPDRDKEEMKNGQTHLQPERKEMASQWLVTKRLSFRQCEATCCGLWLRDLVHHSNDNASGGRGEQVDTKEGRRNDRERLPRFLWPWSHFSWGSKIRNAMMYSCMSVRMPGYLRTLMVPSWFHERPSAFWSTFYPCAVFSTCNLLMPIVVWKSEHTRHC